ncbi:MAG: HAMP domain-containing sensor histidine kinase [Crocinitomicaceae bacterium]
MNLSFKKRIATNFMLATAIITTLVFGTVYFIVQESVFANLDTDLSYEAHEHSAGIDLDRQPIQFSDENARVEGEHQEVEVNPIFMQIVSADGKIQVKTPNLNSNQLIFNKRLNEEAYFNGTLENRNIRQIQLPLLKNGAIKAYIIAAMSLDESVVVLQNLRNTLFVLFPIVLVVLYLVTSYLAGRSIQPVVSIIETTNRISKKNLADRVALPPNKDELYRLSSSINDLLDRIESAMQREKQFTSDASHELRTPLSVLRGTLEVLNRKPRTEEEYKEKIQSSLLEIDRMANIIDQLLEVARIEADPELNAKSAINVLDVITQIIARRSVDILEKDITIEIEDKNWDDLIKVNGFYANLILENIISNALKYSHRNAKIEIKLVAHPDKAFVQIKDYGIGIKKEDLSLLFQPFFRSEAMNHNEIKGNGLGLSIVQKAANAISAKIHIESEFNEGTEVTILFKEILREI